MYILLIYTNTYLLLALVTTSIILSTIKERTKLMIGGEVLSIQFRSFFKY